MEEGHVDWAEMQRSRIEQMGMKNYLLRLKVWQAKGINRPKSEVGKRELLTSVF